MKYPRIQLKPGKEEPLRRYHPWVFSGAIQHADPGIEEGELVEVVSSRGDFLGTGHAQAGSIAVKLLSFRAGEIHAGFWLDRLQTAYRWRQALLLENNSETNAYRLVFGEGDALPGLVIDYYNGTAVLQAHSIGMYLAFNDIIAALQTIYGDKLQSVFSKSADTLSKLFHYDAIDAYLLGSRQDTRFQENGISYLYDSDGQKTGHFCDQRENRALVGAMAGGKQVLDVFCYSGGFSLNALKGGAARVVAVDSSKAAIGLFEENCRAMQVDTPRYQAVVQDAKRYLDALDWHPELIVLDPPAFAKHQADRGKALHGYKNINAAALKMIAPGGLLFTFSCSQAIDRASFQSAVMAAAIESGRNVRLLHHLSQAPDHPVSLFHPEGEYLKGLCLGVD